MQANAKRVFAVAALSAVLLSACALPPPRLDAEAQWNRAMEDLGMFGIYPPSEDVMVGDTFLYLPDAPFFNLVRITSAPAEELAQQFCWQEGDRFALDVSPPRETREQSAGERRAALPAAGLRGNVVCPRHDDRGPNPRRTLRQVAPYNAAEAQLANRVTRLREAAMPTLEVGRFSQTQVAGGLTSGNIGLALGFGGSSASAVRVSLDELQSATLEEVRGFRLIELVQLRRLHVERERTLPERERESRPDPNALTPLMLARSLWHADNRGNSRLLPRFCDGRFQDLANEGVRIMVANRVLYAGGVTFDFLSEDVFATRFALDFASVLANARQNPQFRELPGPPGNQNPPPPRDQARPPPQGAAALDAELARLAGFANNLLTLNAGGAGQASGRLTVGRFGNLALRRDFVRPAAVGMGAALHFPVHEAAVPVSDEQIQDAIEFCRTVLGDDPNSYAVLRSRLAANKAWIEYLYRRAGWVPAIDSPPTTAQGDPRSPTSAVQRDRSSYAPLRALRPSADIRVRL